MIQSIQSTDRRIQAQYLLDGITVTICKMAKPRKSERTWMSGAKYSIANIGHQSVTLRQAGLGLNRA